MCCAAIVLAGMLGAVRPTVTELAASLGLEPHVEGGFYRETYRAADTVWTSRGERAASTAILFLVTTAAISRLHRLTSDELWVFQGGLPLELVTLSPAGEARSRLLGGCDRPRPVRKAAAAADPPSDPLPQALAPAGSWQGARLAGGPHLPASRAWALVTCVVSPGFEYEDFELGERETLLAEYPAHAELVRAFT